jgi:nucleotide-binding universal stress UspA family protein
LQATDSPKRIIHQESADMTFNAILWPTDASPASLRALKTAVDLARTFRASLSALQVLSPVPMPAQSGFASPGPATVEVPLYEQQLLEEVKKSLQKTVADEVPRDIAVDTDVRFGEPDEVIVEVVRETGIDMIVMATHARTGWAHFFLGSVAERVLRSSPVPVLAVPPPPEGNDNG